METRYIGNVVIICIQISSGMTILHIQRETEIQTVIVNQKTLFLKLT